MVKERARRFTPTELEAALAEVKNLPPDEAARALMHKHGGHKLPKATPGRQQRAARDKDVRIYVDLFGYDRAAAHFGLSPRQVDRICNGR